MVKMHNLTEDEHGILSLSMTSANLTDGVVITTAEPKPRILHVNAAFARLVNYPAGALTGQTLDGLQVPQTLAHGLSQLHAQVLENGSFFREVLLRRRDDEAVVVEWQATPVVRADGGHRHLFSIVRNVSPQRKDRPALVDDRRVPWAALDVIDDAVVCIDNVHRIEDMNAAAHALTGWPIDEARGRPLGDVVRIIDPAAGWVPSGEPVAVGPTGSAQVLQPGRQLLLSRDGRQAAIQVRFYPQTSPDGTRLGAVVVLRELPEARRPEGLPRQDSKRDDLTGLINRTEFKRRLVAAVASAKQRGRAHVLCYIDLDHFAQINNAYGQAAGDAVLRQVAGLLRTRFRGRDAVARLGGDEFGLLLDNCSLDEAERLCQRVVDNFATTRFPLIDAPAVAVTPSIGLVQVTAASVNARKLLLEGDIACFTAKKLGRGRSHIYRSDHTATRARDPIVLYPQEFRAALDEDRFQLYYQPIVPLQKDSGLSIHYEFLLRHRSECGQLILPGALIAAAERHGLMAAVDRWVIRTALRQLGNRHSRFVNTAIAINLSGNSLDDLSLVDYVAAQFAVNPIRPSSVCFEITETEAIRDLSRAVEVVYGLKKLGCLIALDDFGSGQSSFTYLKALPADYLKIDGSFVREIIGSPANQSIVAAINQTGRIMGLKTIAEFAHNAEIVDRLRELGVDYAQGDAVAPARPVPPLDSAQHETPHEAEAAPGRAVAGMLGAAVGFDG